MFQSLKHMYVIIVGLLEMNIWLTVINSLSCELHKGTAKTVDSVQSTTSWLKLDSGNK